MPQQQVFEFEGKRIRVYVINNEMWFCGKDAGTILAYKNPTKAVRDHVKDKYKKPLNELLSEAADDVDNLCDQLASMALTWNASNSLYITSRLPNKSRFVSWARDIFDLRYDVVNSLYKEQETVGQLMTAFEHLNCQRQHRVLPTRTSL